MARYNLEQAVALGRADPRAGARGVRPARARGSASADDEVVEWAGVRRGDAHPVRRGPRHPPAGRLLPRPRGVGPQPTPPRSCGRCCCTTTRWSSTASRCSSRPTSCSPCSSTATGSPPRRSAPTSSTTTRSRPATRRCRRSCSRSSRPRWATTRRAYDYFLQALYVDLADLHGNTVDGLHVASTGGVWGALVNGFGGMRDHGGRLAFDPRLPDGWESLTLPGHLARHPGAGRRSRHPSCAFERRGGRAAGAGRGARDRLRRLPATSRSCVALDGHGPRHPGHARQPTADRRHPRRRQPITAGVPDPMPADHTEIPDAAAIDGAVLEPLAPGPD